MTHSSLRTQLGIVEAQLFASTELAVVHAIDKSSSADEASTQLQQLGMSEAQALIVLDMPLRARLQDERAALFAEAERLRDLIG